MLTLNEEHKFHLIFAQGNESSREWSSWEQEFQGMKVSRSEMELSFPGAKVRGNQSSCYLHKHTVPEVRTHCLMIDAIEKCLCTHTGLIDSIHTTYYDQVRYGRLKLGVMVRVRVSLNSVIWSDHVFGAGAVDLVFDDTLYVLTCFWGCIAKMAF